MVPVLQTTPVLSMLGLVSQDPFAFVGGDVEQRQFNGYTMGTMANNVQLGVFDCTARAEIDTEVPRRPERDLRVRLWQNEVEQTIPGCDAPGCPLSVVQALLSKMACNESEFKARCGGLTCKKPPKNQKGKAKKQKGKKHRPGRENVERKRPSQPEAASSWASDRGTSWSGWTDWSR